MLKTLIDRVNGSSGEVPLTVVYTMGKVASTAYSAAIADTGLPCIDVHSLRPDYLLRRAGAALREGRDVDGHVIVSLAHHRHATDTARCRYVTGVREPIERNLSAFFQNIGDWDRGKALSQQDFDALFKRFLRDYPHHVPARWFDDEMKACLGIDVFELPFDKEVGVQVSHRHQLAILRIDAPRSRREDAISQLIGEKVRVPTRNVGSAKNTGRSYEGTIARARFSSDFLDDVYATDYAEHFWTEAQRHAFKARWLELRCGS